MKTVNPNSINIDEKQQQQLNRRVFTCYRSSDRPKFVFRLMVVKKKKTKRNDEIITNRQSRVYMRSRDGKIFGDSEWISFYLIKMDEFENVMRIL